MNNLRIFSPRLFATLAILVIMIALAVSSRGSPAPGPTLELDRPGLEVPMPSAGYATP